MKAVVYKGKGQISLEERPMPELLDAKDAIVKVTLTTICSSDIHIKHGAVPRAVPGTILGHEFVGEVVETGSAVNKVKPGDRVSVNVETFCGECFFCKRGFVNNCEDEHGGWALGCRIDGGQAEYVRIPYADNGLTVIPDGVTDEQALFNGDILSTGYWAAKIGEIHPADTVAVIGAGPTGLCTMLCARLYTPAKIIAIDTDEYRLGLAKAKGLADLTLVPGRDDIGESVRKATGGRGADTVFEVAGGADTFQTAWQIARPNAVVVVVAMYEEPQMLPLPDMYGKNLVFKTGGVDGSYCQEIMDLTACGKLDAGFLITHRCRLEERHQSYLGDLRSLPKSMWEQFDVVSCNPPYFSAGTGETSQIPEHRLARHEEGCTLEEVCLAAGRLLRYGGRFCLCQRPQRLAEVFAAMSKAGLEPKRLRLVSKRWDTAPWLALVEGKKGASPGLTVLPLLALYDENGLRPDAAAWTRNE